eukprot:GSA120T00006261001.1
MANLDSGKATGEGAVCDHPAHSEEWPFNLSPEWWEKLENQLNGLDKAEKGDEVDVKVYGPPDRNRNNARLVMDGKARGCRENKERRVVECEVFVTVLDMTTTPATQRETSTTVDIVQHD